MTCLTHNNSVTIIITEGSTYWRITHSRSFAKHALFHLIFIISLCVKYHIGPTSQLRKLSLSEATWFVQSHYRWWVVETEFKPRSERVRKWKAHFQAHGYCWARTDPSHANQWMWKRGRVSEGRGTATSWSSITPGTIQERALGPRADGSNDLARTVRKGPRPQAEGVGHSWAGKWCFCSKQTKNLGQKAATTLLQLQIPRALPRTWHGTGPRQTERHIH